MIAEPGLVLHEPCPNCGALNPVEMLVCAACGVSLKDYIEVLPRLREKQDERLAEQKEEIERGRFERHLQERQENRRHFQRLLILALAFSAVMLVIAILAVVALASAKKDAEKRKTAELECMAVCLQEGDYRCARDESISFLRWHPGNFEARQILRNARFGLAQQFADAGQFNRAIDELDDILIASPGDEDALELLKNVYDRYILDAKSRGNLIQAKLLRMRRDALFSPEGEP